MDQSQFVQGGNATQHCRRSGGVLGHSTIRMTERYAHQAPENIRVAVAKLGSLSQFGPNTDFEASADA